MSNVAVAKKEALLKKETICPNCESEIKHILSETNSQYSYCQVCDYNNSTIIKHIIFDKLLTNIQRYFMQVSRCSIHELNIYIKIDNECISIYRDDENICKLHLSCAISNRDISILKNTITDLVEDNFEEGRIRSNINICDIKSA